MYRFSTCSEQISVHLRAAFGKFIFHEKSSEHNIKSVCVSAADLNEDVEKLDGRIDRWSSRGTKSRGRKPARFREVRDRKKVGDRESFQRASHTLGIRNAVCGKSSSIASFASIIPASFTKLKASTSFYRVSINFSRSIRLLKFNIGRKKLISRLLEKMRSNFSLHIFAQLSYKSSKFLKTLGMDEG